MHIFIDESGNPSPNNKPKGKSPVCCLAALVVPDTQVQLLNTWLLSLENNHGKKIKGSEIDDRLRCQILQELRNFDVFVECNSIDMTFHNDITVTEHKQGRSFVLANPPAKNPNLAKMRSDFSKKIIGLSNQLYIQANMMWALVEKVILLSTIYYSRTRPCELENFYWNVDSKEKGKILETEKLLTELLPAYLQCQPPLICVSDPAHDYSYLEKFAVKDIETWQTDTGLKLTAADYPISATQMIKEHFYFKDDVLTPGLRIVDLVSNTIYKILNGKGNADFIRLIGQLIFIREPDNCVGLSSLRKISEEEGRKVSYKKAVWSMRKYNRSIWSN